ncbi:Dirigent protein 21 [Dichanthelium oligosanthes]|uniref:Dirigent protein n=1 Tax=Dichanthelium oligosanthes TaxID=888268 RepID=A0A1E5VI82_9POAL|nr:Dirigent protein 21 [Dichanthelium oligosanthes]
MSTSKHAMLFQLSLIALSLAGVVAASAPTRTHLQFYMHDIVTPSPGTQATVARVARGTTPLPTAPTTNFGDMYAIDDPLTEGPDAASRAVGRAQGFYLFASQTELALLLSINMVFTAGPHNGSTVAVLARDLIPADVRELPVVGGTGAFRGVTGYGLLRTHFHNVSAHNAVLRIDMYLSV